MISSRTSLLCFYKPKGNEGEVGGNGLTERAKRTLERISPSGELIKPEQIAETVMWLSSNASEKVNGQSVVIDGGGIMR